MRCVGITTKRVRWQRRFRQACSSARARGAFPGWAGIVYPASGRTTELAREGLRDYARASAAAHRRASIAATTRRCPLDDLRGLRRAAAGRLPAAASRRPPSVTRVTRLGAAGARAARNPDFLSVDRLIERPARAARRRHFARTPARSSWSFRRPRARVRLRARGVSRRASIASSRSCRAISSTPSSCAIALLLTPRYAAHAAHARHRAHLQLLERDADAADQADVVRAGGSAVHGRAAAAEAGHAGMRISAKRSGRSTGSSRPIRRCGATSIAVAGRALMRKQARLLPREQQGRRLVAADDRRARTRAW